MTFITLLTVQIGSMMDATKLKEEVLRVVPRQDLLIAESNLSYHLLRGLMLVFIVLSGK